MSILSNAITPTVVDPVPAEEREMSQLGQGHCWFKASFGHAWALKPVTDANVLFIHQIEWHSKGHLWDPDCEALYEISGGYTIVLPIRTEPDMFTVGAACPRCGELLTDADLKVTIEYMRVTKKQFIDASGVHAAPSATQ